MQTKTFELLSSDAVLGVKVNIMEDKDYSTGRGDGQSRDSFMIKAVAWFIALCVVGFVACVILGMLKVAIQAMVIVAAILMFIALLGWVGYEKIKNRIELRRDDNS